MFDMLPTETRKVNKLTTVSTIEYQDGSTENSLRLFRSNLSDLDSVQKELEQITETYTNWTVGYKAVNEDYNDKSKWTLDVDLKQEVKANA
jgi:hypothetical protein